MARPLATSQDSSLYIERWWQVYGCYVLSSNQVPMLRKPHEISYASWKNIHMDKSQFPACATLAIPEHIAQCQRHSWFQVIWKKTNCKSLPCMVIFQNGFLLATYLQWIHMIRCADSLAKYLFPLNSESHDLLDGFLSILEPSLQILMYVDPKNLVFW
jgi:hypothetical protein